MSKRHNEENNNGGFGTALLVLVLILLQFKASNENENRGKGDRDSKGAAEGPVVDNSILFIITLAFLVCCGGFNFICCNNND